MTFRAPEVIKLSTGEDIYFNEDDVLKIFSICHNIKHLAMLHTLFYGCLRASELCHLDDGDIDLKNLTIRVREGKGGRDGIVYLSNPTFGRCNSVI